MALINENFLNIPSDYLFSEVAKKVKSYKVTRPKRKIIDFGVSDVTQPIPSVVAEAMHKAVDDLSKADSFHGYTPKNGYSFLRDAIIKHEYAARGVSIEGGEIFINEGAKSDTGNIGDILGQDNCVGVIDPAYPVYINSNVIYGRAGISEGGIWSNIVYIPCTAETDFIPDLPSGKLDILYLSYPNNPTGTVLTKEELKKWVDYALANDVLILFDASYEAFIQDSTIPHSIYEIKGAKKVAIEFRSYSRTLAFTGVRCGYTVIPKELNGFTLDGTEVSLNKLWRRRQDIKYNGASYIAQRGAEASYTPAGMAQVKELVDYYMTNARLLKEGFTDSGLKVYGGNNAPFIWVRSPRSMTSWKFFDNILYEYNIVGTPGCGFGPSGDCFLRFSALGSREDTEEAANRLRKKL